MELLQNNPHVIQELHTDISHRSALVELKSTSKPFIEANTIDCSLEEIRSNHIIPVFIKDNEPLISHVDFIDTVLQVVEDNYHFETILQPSIRLSHPIKGRVPEAKNKPAIDLLEGERTIHYEHMAFVIEIPTVYDEIGGNKLSLTVGGVKAYNLDNLYAKKGSDQHFKIFIGFKNTVCTNLCVWTDGLMSNVKVSNVGQLQAVIRSMIENYNIGYQLYHLKQLCEYSLTEQQFAILIGRCRMYQHLSKRMQADIKPLSLGDSQINNVVRDYYKDNSFCKTDDGTINLWKVYNLFTNANKASYIDSFLERGVNAYQFCESLKKALKQESSCWFLN